MPEDYTFSYTDGYGQKGNKNIRKLTISGDCKITNYTQGSGDKKGEITIDFTNGKQDIRIGKGKGKEKQKRKQADFSKEKFSIFGKIAALAGDTTKLSIEDIEIMRENETEYVKAWGLKDIRFDLGAGIATLVWNEKEIGGILKIDFVTKKDLSTEATTANKTSKTSKKGKTNDPYLQQIFAVYKSSGILDDSYDVYIKDIVDELEVSEDLVKLIIISESLQKKAYYCAANELTIGFGHTHNTPISEDIKGYDKIKKFKKFKFGDPINTEQAFILLKNDIKHHKNEVIKAIGLEKYNELLEADKEELVYAFIDYSFNAGVYKRFKCKLFTENMKSKDYIVVATKGLWNEGYYENKRSFFRWFLATAYMSDKDRSRALAILEQEQQTNDSSYLASAKKTLYGKERKIVESIINQIKENKAQLANR